MLVKKIVDLLFYGIAALFKASNDAASGVTSRGGVLDSSQIETYSDDEGEMQEKDDKEL